MLLRVAPHCGGIAGDRVVEYLFLGLFKCRVGYRRRYIRANIAWGICFAFVGISIGISASLYLGEYRLGYLRRYIWANISRDICFAILGEYFLMRLLHIHALRPSGRGKCVALVFTLPIKISGISGLSDFGKLRALVGFAKLRELSEFLKLRVSDEFRKLRVLTDISS